MKNRVLKIIADNSKDARRVLKESGDNNLSHSSGWYLHGELQERCGYDLATIYNMSDHPKEYMKTLIGGWIQDNKIFGECREVCKSHLQGIYPVEVHGIEEPCIGYFWVTNEMDIENTEVKHWRQRGLVVLESDIEANKHAKKCYEENKDFL